MAATCDAHGDDLLSRDLQKRYNGLLMVRTKAIRGKGAWYWSHLEPILFQNQDTTAKALKLRCGLCNALFSASNPSRTASEHLKRGICPNFQSTEAKSNGTLPKFKFRKHTQMALPAELPSLALIPAPCSIPVQQPNSPTGPQLNQTQIETAFDLLSDWFYESCGYVSLSTINHPKFRAFLHHVGVPPVKLSAIMGRSLDIKYMDARMQFEDKVQDAMFFQISTNGWKSDTVSNNNVSMDALVKVVVNLPNGSSLFHRVLSLGASDPCPDYMREVMCSIVREVTGSNVFRCAGIVADIGNVNCKALRELELHHNWMANLTCQSKALQLLLKDFFKRLPLFASTASLCHKFIQIFIFKAHHNFNDINVCLNSHQSLSLEQTSAAISAIENVAQFSGAPDQAFAGKVVSTDPLNKEISDAIQAPKFWEDLDAIMCLTKLIKSLVQEIEEDRPCLGQCLPLWEEVKSRIGSWCKDFSIEEKPVMELVNRRFLKNYHQAWAASYVLDPLNLVEDSCGRYLPPFKFLTSEQDKDVVKVITRLTQNEDAHIALMELMKWRTEGLDPLYARAVRVKERDQVSGKMKVANPCGSRLVWETYLTEFRVLRKVAARLIFLQATTSGLKWKQPFSSWFCSNRPSNNAVDKVQKILFVSLHKGMEKEEFTDEREKDSMLYNCKNEEIYPTVV